MMFLRSTWAWVRGACMAFGLPLVASGPVFAGESAVSPAVAAPGWLGISMDKGAPPDGVGVKHVVRGSPAERGGVRIGDRLVRIDNVSITDPAHVTRLVAAHAAGETVVISVRRGSAMTDLRVVLDRRPSGSEILRMDHVGAFAPPWTVKPLGGAPSSLAQLRGKVVVLDFWATWCVPCRFLAPKLSGLQSRYGAQGLRVVGVTTDSAEVAAVFVERTQMKYGILIDDNAETTLAYGISAMPTLFVIDKRGVVRSVSIGYDPSRDATLESLVQTLLAEPMPAASSAGAAAELQRN